MKKLLTLILALAILATTACTGDDNPEDTDGRIDAPSSGDVTPPSIGGDTTASNDTTAPDTSAPDTTAPDTDDETTAPDTDEPDDTQPPPSQDGYFPQSFDSLADMIASIGDNDKVEFVGGEFYELKGLPAEYKEVSCEYHWYDSYSITYQSDVPDYYVAFMPMTEKALKSELANQALTKEFKHEGREFKLAEMYDRDGNFVSAEVYVLDGAESYKLVFFGSEPDEKLLAATYMSPVKADK